MSLASCCSPLQICTQEPAPRKIDYNRNKEVTSTNNLSSWPIPNGSREALSLSGISYIALDDIRQICDHKWSIPTPRYHINRTRKSIKHSKHKRHIEQIKLYLKKNVKTSVWFTILLFSSPPMTIKCRRCVVCAQASLHGNVIRVRIERFYFSGLR
jgi:hypothetical protein